MIKLVHNNLRPFQAFISLTDCNIDYCSKACAFHDLPDSFQVVRHGSNANPAIIDNKKLWLNISDGTHPTDHPLYLVEQKITKAERSSLLKRIQTSQPEHIVTVYAVCHCGMVIEIIEGLPLADIGTHPAWHRQMYHRDGMSDTWTDMTWSRFLKIMIGLSEGIQSLHDQRLVHADLFPFNAIVTPDGQGVWLDLNDVLPVTALGIATDIWTFINYTFLFGVCKLKNWQPSVVSRIAEIIAVEKLTEILPAIITTLRQAAKKSEVVETAFDETSFAALVQIFQKSNVVFRTDELGQVARSLTLKGQLHFFAAFDWNARAAFERERWLAAEQARHNLVERELQRTLSLRYQSQISELKAWNSELQRTLSLRYQSQISELKAWNSDLEQGKTWLEEQWHNWQEIAEKQTARIEEQQAWIKKLEQGKTWLEEQWHNWQEIAEKQTARIEEQQAWIKKLEQGKTWLEEQWNYSQSISEERRNQLEQCEAQLKQINETLSNLQSKRIVRLAHWIGWTD